MPTYNKDIADIFEEMADLLYIKGENQYRIRSYRNASQSLRGLSEDVAKKAKNNEKISSIPGIGESMSDKIKEIVETGQLKQLNKLKKEIPDSLLDIMRLSQMGPKKTRHLREELGINNLEDLKAAAEQHKLEQMPGFGKKTTDKLLKEIKTSTDNGEKPQMKYKDAEEIVTALKAYLCKEMENITVAGSFRRKRETVGDIDILATSRNSAKSMDHFVNYEDTSEIISKGKTRSSIKLRMGLQVDLRIVKKKEYGAALSYFTGSRDHSIALRKEGKKKDFKVSEYGVFKGKKQIAGKTEKDIYKALGYKFIKPELREMRGWLEKKDVLNTHSLAQLRKLLSR